MDRESLHSLFQGEVITLITVLLLCSLILPFLMDYEDSLFKVISYIS